MPQNFSWLNICYIYGTANSTKRQIFHWNSKNVWRSSW